MLEPLDVKKVSYQLAAFPEDVVSPWKGGGDMENWWAHCKEFRDAQTRTHRYLPHFKADIITQDPFFTIRMVDTPGLADTDGDDDMIMQGILLELRKASLPVCAVLCLMPVQINGGTLACFERYWMQFPDLRQQFIFVHTKMDPLASESTFTTTSGARSPCFDLEIHNRKRIVVETMQNIVERRAPDSVSILQTLPHVFVDSKIDRPTLVDNPSRAQRDAYEENLVTHEVKKSEQAKALMDLSTRISSNVPVELKNLKYHKSIVEVELDKTVLAHVTGNTDGFQKALHAVGSNIQRHVQTLVDFERAVGDNQRDVTALKAWLKDHDQEDHVVVSSRHHQKDPQVFGGVSESASVMGRGHAGRAHVSHVLNPAYAAHTIAFGNPKIRQDGDTIICDYTCSAPMWRGFDITVKLTQPKRDVHAQMIKEKTRHLEAKTRDLDKVREQQAELEKSQSHCRQQMAIFQRMISEGQAIANRVHSNAVPIENWIQQAEWYRQETRAAEPKTAPELVRSYADFFGLPYTNDV